MVDAVVLLSYGGPYKPEDVVPFLRNATHGRGIPDERLEEVGEHYYKFGGKSPINEHNEELRQAISKELAARGVDLPIYIGNRNWKPFVEDVFANIHADGHRNILAIPTSAYHSYSSSIQYHEDVQRSLEKLGTPAEHGMKVTVADPFFDTTGFIEANTELIAETFTEPVGKLLFITHSIPNKMNNDSESHGYPAYTEQHLWLIFEILGRLKERGIRPDWELAYCSRSGSPHVPWLEPDVCDRIEQLAKEGETGRIVLSPFGFISDHMEVVHDLDIEAKETCEKLGIPMERAATVGTHPAFVDMLVSRIIGGEPDAGHLLDRSGRNAFGYDAEALGLDTEMEEV